MASKTAKWQHLKTRARSYSSRARRYREHDVRETGISKMPPPKQDRGLFGEFILNIMLEAEKRRRSWVTNPVGPKPRFGIVYDENLQAYIGGDIWKAKAYIEQFVRHPWIITVVAAIDMHNRPGLSVQLV